MFVLIFMIYNYDESRVIITMSRELEEHIIPSYCFTYCQQSCIEQTLSLQFKASLVFSILAIIVSVAHICMHLSNFNNPFFQSKIIIILIMPAFYCVTSIGSFLLPSYEIYFTLTRDSYEAILLFVFFYLMFSYLAYDRDLNLTDDKKVYTIMISHEREVHHFWPFYYCQKPYQLTHWKKAKYFTYRCKKYVLQFLVVKLFTTILMYIIYPHHSEVNFQEQDNSNYLLISSIVNWIVAISASYSLYYLVLFYHALSHPLAPYSALLKFLTIKVTIFFTFWQRIMILMFEEDMLACFNKEAPHYNQREIVASLENTLICFEMLLMSLACFKAYDYENYVSDNEAKQGKFKDVIDDTIRAFKNDFRLIKPKKFGFTTKTNLEQIELIDIKLMDRTSVLVSIKAKCSLADCMVEDYL